MFTRLIVITSLFLLSGCMNRDLIISNHNKKNTLTEEISQEKTIIPRIAFPEDEYKALAKSGRNTIKGNIYITNPDGKKIYGKNTRLYLNPVTSYSEQWYNESYIGGYQMQKANKRLFNYLKYTASNKKGNFAFFGVPNGSYYVIGVVKCGSSCGYDGKKSIRVVKEITVNNAESVDIELSRHVE